LYLTAEEAKTSNNYDFDGDGVAVPLISALGHGKAAIKRVHRVKGRFALANLLAYIEPDTTQVIPDFLYLVLNNQKDEIAKLMKGAANVSMKVKDLENYKIFLPPVQTQKEITKEVEGYQKIINGAKQMSENWFPVPQIDSSWPIKSIKEVADVNPPKPSVEEWHMDKDVSFLPMSSLDVNSPNPFNMGTRKLKDVIKGYTSFQNDDVLLAKITPCFENGKSGTVKNLSGGIGFGSTEFIVIRAKKDIVNPLWIWLFIYQKEFIEHGKKQMTGSAGQKRIPVSFVENYQIPVPSLAIQTRQITKLQMDFDLIKDLKKNVIPEFEEKIKKVISDVNR
jgi:restriction endonuclease S subunit